MIDNYDSFTYNLVQYFKELGEEVYVCRNDQTTVEQLAELDPSYIVISPGPSNPDHAGISLDVIEHFAGRLPILGVCLGHQVIGQAFGGKIVPADRPMHGKTSTIIHDGRTLFQGLPVPLTVARYHSLLVDANLPDELEVSAISQEGEIMAIRHKKYAIEGVQFHPESIICSYGKEMLANFLATYDLSSVRRTVPVQVNSIGEVKRV